MWKLHNLNMTDQISFNHTDALKETLRRLNGNPVILAAAENLTANSNLIDSELEETILAEIPAFSESRNPDVLPDLARHGPLHTQEILRLLRGKKLRDFEFVHMHVQKRAEQRFPLEAILHTYRCGHKVFSRWMRKAVLTNPSASDNTHQTISDLADFALEYTDTISTIAASTYVAQTRLLADVAGDQRAELLNLLLEGHDESDGRVAKILRDAGFLERRQSFCVAVLRSVDPAEMLNLARARRIADSVNKIFQSSSIRHLVDLRDNKVTVVFSDIRRLSGWTAPRATLAKKVAAELMKMGNAVLTGVSNDVPSTSHIPKAYREALLGLDLSNVGNRVVQFSKIPAQRMILHLAGEEFQRVLPSWSAEFFESNHKSGGALANTLKAYADANMNLLKTAEILSVHPNTIYARTQKILDITGLDMKSYHGLTELLLVADSQGRHNQDRQIKR